MYETRLDPFAEFKNRETKSKNLNPAERLVMLTTQMIIGNKYSRMIFVLYSLALHILVVFAVYEVMTFECAGTGTRANQIAS
jgi:homeobox protein cut-like